MFTRLKSLLTLLVVAFLTTASAMNLTGYLPNSTAFAIGGVDFKANEDVFDVFIDEWNKLGLTDMLTAIASDELDEDDFELPSEFADLNFLDILGTEFWFAVGADFMESEDMMPEVVFVSTLTGDAKANLESLFEEQVAEGEMFVEDVADMRVYSDEDGEMAIAFDGDVLVFALGADGVAEARSRNLNRMAGIAQSPAWAGTVGAVPNGTLYSFMDFSALSESALMLEFLAGEGIGVRLQGILEAVGALGSVTTITADGMEVEMRLLHGSGGAADAGLTALIAGQANRTANPAFDRFVADGALAYQNMSSDFTGGWNWFNGLFEGLPILEEIGFDSSVNDLIAAFTGVDVTHDLLSWMTGEAAMVTLSYPTDVSLDALTMNTTDLSDMNLATFVGDSVLILGVTDGDLADNTISQLLPTIGMFASMMADPFGEEMHFPMAQMSDIGGVSISGWPLLGGDHATLYTATVDSYLVFATSEHAMTETIQAYQAGGGIPPSLQQIVDVPANASAYQYSNAQAAFDSIASSYGTQLATLGMLLDGDDDVDFATIETIGNTLIEFLDFVGSRFSYASGYSVYEDGVSVTYGKTLINW